MLPAMTQHLTATEYGLVATLTTLLAFCAPVHAGGERVGLATSGFWSFTLARSVALAYVRSDLAEPGGKVEVEVFGRRVAATTGREPLYDPENARLRG